jgi:hypothetical protein
MNRASSHETNAGGFSLTIQFQVNHLVLHIQKYICVYTDIENSKMY